MSRLARWVWLVLLLVAAGPAPAQLELAAPLPPPSPSLLEAVEPAQDAGVVLEGAQPRYTFTLINRSQATLNLKVSSGCGCTVTRMEPTLAAGASATLEVSLSTRGFNGPVSKAITVSADDPGRSRVMLKVLATVRPLVRVSPERTAHLALPDRGATSTEFALIPQPGQQIAFTDVTSTVPYVHAQLLPGGVPGGLRRLRVTVGPDAPLGRMHAFVTVATNSLVAPKVALTITGEKGIHVSPDQVFWGQLPSSTTPAREEVVLTKRGGRFHVQRVESDDPLVRLTLEPMQEGSQYRLRVSYDGGWKAGQVRHTITVRTDDPRQPVLKIPIWALVLGAGAVEPVF